MNPERASVLDIDLDIEGGRREDVIKAFQRTYGSDRVTKVLTIRTEKAKSSVLTAARGLGIDVDVAQYLSSMIKSPRGMQQTLSQTFYGDPDSDIKPNKEFVKEMTKNYPELWEVAKTIEGLCCGVG